MTRDSEGNGSGRVGRKAASPLWGVLLSAAVAVVAGTGSAAGQSALPFAPGEACVYRGSTVLGRVGTGTLAVERAALDAGSVFLLRFDFRGRVGLAGIEDRTRSWFDPAELGSRRFTKRERSPLASRDEDVRMDPRTRRWRSAGGDQGEMPTSTPLDELSFIYFIRTLPLAPGDSYSIHRHYDAARNPVRIRVVGRAPMRVPAGAFRTIVVEMRVTDPSHYRGEGVIRFHLSDDARRIPVRIESAIPRAGRMVLSLESGTGGCTPAPSTHVG